jgi:hypothetical protein
VPTVLREGGLRVIIYTDDHPPPHVHVFGDGETKIVLTGPDGDSLVVRVTGAKLPESRSALQIVRNNHTYLLQRWTELHG